MRVHLPSGTAAEIALTDSAASRGVVIIPDIAGMRPLFDDLAARLATEQGWAVAVFDPFAGRVLDTIDDRFAAVPMLDDARIMGDATSAADLMVERSGVSRVAVMGFCMGGMYGYKAAANGRFDRAVTFYGMIRVPLAWRGARQAEPLDLLAEPATTPVLAIIGDKDPYTPPEDVAELAKFGARVRAVRFPDAEHGFVHDPDRPAHRPGDAAEAWRQVVQFLA